MPFIYNCEIIQDISLVFGIFSSSYSFPDPLFMRVSRHNQLAELLLCHLYLARFNRERILENRRRAARVDASTQTEQELPSCISVIPTAAPPTTEHASAPEPPPAADLPDSTVPQKAVSTTYRFLEPGAPSLPLKIVVQRITAKQKQRPVPREAIALSPTKRKRTAPAKPGKWAKPRITSNIQLAPPRALENLPEQPIDLTVED